MTSTRTEHVAEAAQLTPVFDTDRLVAELAGVTGHLWQPQRAHAASGPGAATALDWRVLPLRSPGGDAERTDPGGPGPLDYAPTTWLQQLPYLRSIIEGIPAPVHAARLMALGPGAACSPHRDPKYALARGFVRLHLPLITHRDAVLTLDGVEHCWQPGTLWWGEFAREHAVSNRGSTTRVHAVIDALLTRELADWFPSSVLDRANVLFNHSASPPASASIRPLANVRVPRGFTDFDNQAPLDGDLHLVDLAADDAGRWMLIADHRQFLLTAAGPAECRFVGWSEQRTLQITGDGIFLRARHGRDQAERFIPAPIP